MERWKPTDADMLRLTLHRTWFTWPSWLVCAVIMLKQYDEETEEMLFRLRNKKAESP